LLCIAKRLKYCNILQVLQYIANIAMNISMKWEHRNAHCDGWDECNSIAIHCSLPLAAPKATVDARTLHPNYATNKPLVDAERTTSFAISYETARCINAYLLEQYLTTGHGTGMDGSVRNDIEAGWILVKKRKTSFSNEVT
jgi:hypothetical protein